jgi:hypothetical protein
MLIQDLRPQTLSCLHTRYAPEHFASHCLGLECAEEQVAVRRLASSSKAD